MQVSTQIQEEKVISFESFEQNSEEFISEVIRIDSEVADIVKQRKEEFYRAYSYLKPESEKDWKEKAADWLKSVGEWCKEQWTEMFISTVIVMGAVLTIVAVIGSGGLALVPMLTALSMTLRTSVTEWTSVISDRLYSFGELYSSLVTKFVNEGKNYKLTDFKDTDIDYDAIEELEKSYGFTEEEALLLYEAIEKLGKSCGYERDSAAYINYVYGTLSALCISYDATRWRMTAATPNLFQAKNRLYVAGFNSQQILDLQVLINLQHGDFSDETLMKNEIDITKSTFCNETHADMMARCADQNNDFSHQTIQITAFACLDMMLEEDYILPGPWAVALFNSSDFQHSYTKYEISFKGDIDSGRYSEADFQSDVDAINIYSRIRNDNESSLNKIWTEYYREIELGNTNRAKEFFRNLGDGEEDIGIIELDHILQKETFGSTYIQNGNNMSKEDIDKANSIFVQWVFSEYYGFEYEFPN